MSLQRIAAAGLLALAGAALADDGTRLAEIVARAEIAANSSNSIEHYLEGRPEQALAPLRALEEKGDWETAFVLGNMTWRMHPELSLRWHEQALAWSGGNAHSQLEMALQHMRHDRCTEASAAWDAVDAAGFLEGHLSALAAYCHFKQGDYPRAYALLEKSGGSRHGALERVLEEIWGPRPALARHADGVAALRRGEPVEPESLLSATVAIETAQGMRYRGLLAVVEAAGSEPAAGDYADLACLRPALEAERDEAADDPGYLPEPAERKGRLAKAWKRAFDECGLVLPGQRLASGRSLNGLLLQRAIALGLIDAPAALAAHGEALQARATAGEGDLAALEILASLQMLAEDREGLARSDELGWRRFGNARFAASRVIGLLTAAGGPDETVAEAARQAWADFPEDAHVLWLVLDYGQLEGEQRKRALRSQVLAEYRGPTVFDELHVRRSGARLVKALVEYRPLVMPGAG